MSGLQRFLGQYAGMVALGIIRKTYTRESTQRRQINYGSVYRINWQIQVRCAHST